VGIDCVDGEEYRLGYFTVGLIRNGVIQNFIFPLGERFVEALVDFLYWNV